MATLLDDYATEPELAEELRKSVRTLIRWRHHKKLPYIRLGTSILYNRPAVSAWLLAQQVSV